MLTRCTFEFLEERWKRNRGVDVEFTISGFVTFFTNDDRIVSIRTYTPSSIIRNSPSRSFLSRWYLYRAFVSVQPSAISLKRFRDVRLIDGNPECIAPKTHPPVVFTFTTCVSSLLLSNIEGRRAPRTNPDFTTSSRA